MKPTMALGNVQAKAKTSLKILRSIDQAVFQYLLKPPAYVRNRSVPEGLDHHQRLDLIAELATIYPFTQDDDQNRRFFSYGASDPRIVSKSFSYPNTNSDGTIACHELAWESQYEPYWQDHFLTPNLKKLGLDQTRSFRAKYFGGNQNQICRARWYRSQSTPEPRPTIVCFHGYMGGNFRLEEKAWPIENMLEQGFDVVMMVLPFHGQRKTQKQFYKPPRFPSSDPRFTIEALRQTVHDYMSLKGYLKSNGVEEIALAGMSLGGYCTALISVLDPDHSFYMPIIPLAALTELIARQKRLGTDEGQAHIQQQQFSDLLRIVDPLAYRPQFLGAKMKIIYGSADGITGSAHAHLLANHFRTVPVEFAGSHLMRFGLDDVWRRTLLSQKAAKDPQYLPPQKAAAA